MMVPPNGGGVQSDGDATLDAVMITPRAAPLLLPLALVLLTAADARARCRRTVDHVRELERVARGERLVHETGVRCLGLGRQRGRNRRWASAAGARRLAQLRTSRWIPRIKRACARVFALGESRATRECARLLADHGVGRLGKLDVFALQRRLFPHGMDPLHLAALGDRRAVPELIGRFSATRICRPHVRLDGRPGQRCTDFSPRALKRSLGRRRAHRTHRLVVLNALWHLADASCRKFLERVSGSEPDRAVRLRALRVLVHLNERRAGK